MDLATVFGLIFGFLTVAVLGVLLSGGNPVEFINLPSIFITIGGTIATIFVSNPASRVLSAFRIMGKTIGRASINPSETILTLVSFSEKARREGLLALEDDLEELDDEFLKKGIQLVVDGTDPDLVKNIMSTEVDFLNERHDTGRQMFDDLGTLFPAMGMIGTLIGLILMLKNIEDKSSLGRGMSTALITTYYGMVLANLFAIPISNKLRDRHNEEVLLREIMINGVLAIQSGDNPRIVKERLISFLSPSMRNKISDEVGDKR